MRSNKTATLSQKIIEKIDLALEKFPHNQRRSAVMPALTITQDAHNGSLTPSLIDAVADYLRIPRIAAYEVATFYSMYELRPVGRHKICVCTNISCMLCGSDDIVSYLKKKLGVNFGETTQDGKFTLKQVECLAACGGGPMMQIGDQYYEDLTPKKIDIILTSLE